MTTTTQSSPRERILNTAIDLFYRQGYQATGINQIIAEAGVAKASFYANFPSKDDLLLAYAEAISAKEMAEMRAGLATLDTPRDRFYGLFTLLPGWLQEYDFRGCPFQIILAEAPSGDERLHAVAKRHHELMIDLARELLEDYQAANPSLKPVDNEQLARLFVVLMDGAIAAAVAYRDNWPIDQAVKTVKSLVEPVAY
ncbi:TetR/AcrR family transcriptional regulator [Cerasicoccus fimbriatus]|uniref:TetR/AcrR family transcriptional regulator n=1 Tax=Cerasicoccus fimbriatus TaxID=3014554 RepID=UPI0022B4705F|nr:TetR/AcrR family transcriptional regulator [Cerasicoccus sp. TK19100]